MASPRAKITRAAAGRCSFISFSPIRRGSRPKNDDFEGGDLRFAEYGPATYRPPKGGAVVFSCSLMHEATKIAAGRRYAFLPFFYDAAGAATLAAYNERVAAQEAAHP